MLKKDKYSFLGGLNVDMPPSKRNKDQYVMLRNGRITSSYSNGDHLNIPNNGTIRCQSGNELLFEFTSIDSISVNNGSLMVQYKISGELSHAVFVGVVNSEIVALNPSSSEAMSIVSVVADGPYTYFLTTTTSSIDCIWRYSDANGLNLVYINNLGWNDLPEKNLDIVVNVESELVIKVYISDGVHQVFSTNILSTNDLKKPKKVLYMVPQYTMSQPYVSETMSGGDYTSGAVQYSYNLFNVNGGQTKISPASELIFLGKGNYGGGAVNEIVGQTNIVKINNIDPSYDYIRVYVLKYSSLDITPVVSVLGTYASPGANMLTITDDGRSQYDISLDSLALLGGAEIVPRCIIAKKNRLLLANITEDIFDVNWNQSNKIQLSVDDANYFDSRTYSSDVSGMINIFDKFNVESTLDKSARKFTDAYGHNVTAKHDCIQDKSIYFFHPETYYVTDNMSTNTWRYGGEGRHISYHIKKTTTSDIQYVYKYDPLESRYMKCGETYRWAIEFYDNQSRKSTPQWIADVKVPSNYYGFADNTRVTIEFVISAEGIRRLTTQGIVGYKFLRVQRQESDKTIVAQGIITPMIFQVTGDDAKVDANQTQGALFNDQNVKISSPWVRHYQSQIDVPYNEFDLASVNQWPKPLDDRFSVKIFALAQNSCISPTNFTSNPTIQGWNPSGFVDKNGIWPNPWTEIYRDRNNSPVNAAWLHISYQDNRLMQLFSPETIFGSPILTSGMQLRPAMSLKQDIRSCHAKMVYTNTSTVFKELTSNTKTSVFDPYKWNYGNKNGDAWDKRGIFFQYDGYIGPNRPDPTDPGIETEQLIQYYRSYIQNKVLSTLSNGYQTKNFPITGIPELSKYNSDIKTYNNLSPFKYTNSLQTILADGTVAYTSGKTHPNDEWDIPLYGVDAIAAQNITFTASLNTSTVTNDPYESLFVNAFTSSSNSITDNDNVILGEIIATVDNQYGGKYYEDRSLNKYMGVGVYNQITSSSDQTYNIINSGDVFVGDFMFARISRINGASFSYDRMQMSEIVKIPVETTINLRQRNDISFGGWTAKFLPTNDEFHKYNPVYSQEDNSLYSIPDPFLFVRNTQFYNRIMATKPKIAGEIIDSWTDILVNEEVYLEGEYGRINRMVKFNDNLYVFQRDGVSVVSVLPRVQLSGSDAIPIELGVGNVLSTYQYINTNSGCDDFNGIVSTSSATYYGDRIRRTVNIIEGATVSGLSDTLGLSQYVKGYDTNELVKPVFILGFNPITDDVYITIKKQKNSVDDIDIIETLVYDEGIKRFTSILDMPAEFVFTIDAKLHSVSSFDDNQNRVWSHFIGSKSCNFYGVQYPLELTVCLNPEFAENDNIFNMIEWTHDIVDTTNPTIHYQDNITGFSAWNDYQTANTPSLPADIRRRFRMSRLFIPRDTSNNFDRMRGYYLFVKLIYIPDNSNKTILLNDIYLSYNTQR